MQTGPASVQAAAPTIATAPAQNGAVVVMLKSATGGAAIYYTVDGTIPSTSSQIYEAPFLVASNLTVNAMATATGETNSSVTSQAFAANIPSGTLVWSDEFSNTTSANTVTERPRCGHMTQARADGATANSKIIAGGNSSASPCMTAAPNAYVGTDGYLHIVAQQPSAGAYTSARLKTGRGCSVFSTGRIEFRAQVPEAQGFWPAAWLMGNNIATANWPGCGEMDVLERVDAAGTPDWNEGSVHGTGFTGGNLGTRFSFPTGQTAAGWHTYGMIWSKGSVAYYVDTPAQPYVTYTPSSISGLSGSVWPFDGGQANFIILNMAVGGSWPGNPDVNTMFPAQMLVDYVRIYTN